MTLLGLGLLDVRGQISDPLVPSWRRLLIVSQAAFASAGAIGASAIL